MFKEFLELQYNVNTSRVGNKWSPEEDYKLLIEISDNKSFEDIALEHKRTIIGIKARVISHILYSQYKDENKTIEELSSIYNIEKNIIEKYIKIIENNNATKKSIENFKFEKYYDIYGVKTNVGMLLEKITSIKNKINDIEQNLTIINSMISIN
jgi:hypothetical protein